MAGFLDYVSEFVGNGMADVGNTYQQILMADATISPNPSPSGGQTMDSMTADSTISAPDIGMQTVDAEFYEMENDPAPEVEQPQLEAPQEAPQIDVSG
jgi:hypothetical protein